MKTKQQITKLFTGILAVTALFVSSASACVCSHHQTKASEEKASCHSHDDPENKQQPVASVPLVSEVDCTCIQPTPRVVSKGGKFGFDDKTPAAATYFSVAEPLYSLTALAVVQTFAPPDYLSKTFDSPSAPRAPPRL